MLGGKGLDNIYGGAGDDRIEGGEANDWSTSEILSGGAGNNIVIGSGSNRIIGGIGDDVVVAQDNGSDDQEQYLWGGSGADLFVLDDATADVTYQEKLEIYDFNGLEDRVVVNVPEGSNFRIGVVLEYDHFVVYANGIELARVYGENYQDIKASDILIRDTSETGYAYENLVAGGA